MRDRVMLLAIICLIPLFGVTACGDTTGPKETLGAARSLWLQSKVSAYTVTMQISCECNIDMSGPIVARVRNGVVESRRYVGSGEVVPTSLDDWFPSINRLFDLVERGLVEDWSPLEAQYDRELGYPTRVVIPANAGAMIYTVSLLKN